MLLPGCYAWNSDSSSMAKPGEQVVLSQQDCLFLQKIHELVERYLEDMSFGGNELAKKMHLSVSQLYRKIKLLTNKSTANYLRSIRLEIAKKMLEDTTLTISQIAFKTGFTDPSYFIRSYSKEFGITPGKARKAAIKNLPLRLFCMFITAIFQ
jgi:transcriptional regulator GlxA family with amidase domain